MSLFRRKHILGASPQRDERNRLYPVKDILTDAPLRDHRWKCPISLNQGREGACTRFALNHYKAMDPAPIRLSTNAQSFAQHIEDKKHDRMKGEDYDGTWPEDVLAYEQSLGLIGEYRWCMGLDDMRAVLSNVSPLYAKLPLFTGMMRTDAFGRMRVTGVIEGYHMVVFDQIKHKQGHAWIKNSWDRFNWGRNGRGWLSFDDCETLLHAGGMAATIRKV